MEKKNPLVMKRVSFELFFCLLFFVSRVHAVDETEEFMVPDSSMVTHSMSPVQIVEGKFERKNVGKWMVNVYGKRREIAEIRLFNSTGMEAIDIVFTSPVYRISCGLVQETINVCQGVQSNSTVEIFWNYLHDDRLIGGDNILLSYEKWNGNKFTTRNVTRSGKSTMYNSGPLKTRNNWDIVFDFFRNGIYSTCDEP